MIEYSVTFCVVLLTLFDMTEIRPNPKASLNVTKACNTMNSRVPFSTFWLLVSGSPTDRQQLTSSTTCSSFGDFDGKNDEVAGSSNYLFLTKGSLSFMLEDGPDLKNPNKSFRVSRSLLA